MTAFAVPTKFILIDTRQALLDAYEKYLDNDDVIAWEATENPLLTVEVTPIYEEELESIRDRASKPAKRQSSLQAKKGRGKVHKRGWKSLVRGINLLDFPKKGKGENGLTLQKMSDLVDSLHYKDGSRQRAKSGSGRSSKKPSNRKRSVRHGASPKKGGGAQKRGAKGGIKNSPLLMWI